MRIYTRQLSATEILTNAGDQCMTPSNITGLTWYRFHVPAAGDSTTVAGNSTDESTLQHVYPNTVLPTNYNYNSTNQVSLQSSPDGGTNRYWYDLLSRLVISQNDKQNPLSNYSYTKYDTIGRITEVGQKNQTLINISTPHYLTNDTIGYFNAAGTNSQITTTYYDIPVPTTGGHSNGIATVIQNNLRKRVAASTYSDNPGLVNNATYYTYDIDGNVNTIWQQVYGLYTPSTNAGLKRIDYEYDLISGKVNFVRYQDGQNDRFYYHYKYDADNRLVYAWSGVRALVDTTMYSVLQPGFAKLDAKYYYYLHGPLARMEVGDTSHKIQGADYAYTLQGWLKGVNSSAATDVKDMGGDSVKVAKDAYGYSLCYYGTGTDTLDYASISGINPFSTQPAGLSYFKSLYNGNIAGMSTNITKLTDPWHYYTYKYDQLHRLRQTYTYKVNTSAVATRVLDYSERFTYDGNGNIDSAARYMGANTKMDSTLYHYNTSGGRLVNNQLNFITDNVTTHNYPYGLDNQVANNYIYDAIGNMTRDSIDTVSNINWTVYNKIQNLTNSKGLISYSYDPAGQRVTKTANGVTVYYIRDAQGNPLAIYDNTHSIINWKEQDLYGSSRLGRWNVNSNISTSLTETNVWDTVGHKEYELSNHLGNVLTTISDKRLQHSSNSTTVDYFNADIATAQEYYAFGGLMAGRTYTYLKNYRYGFNGKENDNDVKGIGNQQDYGMRIYDPRVGRFYSVDPISEEFPMLSSYQFASNTPIWATDLDGREPLNFDSKNRNNENQVHLGGAGSDIYSTNSMGVPVISHVPSVIYPQGEPITKGLNNVQVYQLAFLRFIEPNKHLANPSQYIDERLMKAEEQLDYFFTHQVPAFSSSKIGTTIVQSAVAAKLMRGDPQAVAQIQKSDDFFYRHSIADFIVLEAADFDFDEQLENLTKIFKRSTNLVSKGYQAGWATANLNEVITKLLGDNPDFSVTETGKVIWSSKKSTLQVVQDPLNSYFRIEDLSITSKNKYVGLDGKPIPTKIPGKPGGLKSGDYDQLTHFTYSY